MADKTLTMTFRNADGNTCNINVPGVKDGITEAQVSAVMDTILEKGIFFSTGGDLQAKVSAQIVNKDVNKLEVR